MTICIALLVTVSIPEIHSEVGQVQVGYGLVLFAVFAPLLALAIRQLVASDKMTPDQAMSGGLVFLGIAAVSVGSILWRLRRRVLPRRRRLQALLRQFDEQGEVG